jgi:hypothetical protein
LWVDVRCLREQLTGEFAFTVLGRRDAILEEDVEVPGTRGSREVIPIVVDLGEHRSDGFEF